MSGNTFQHYQITEVEEAIQEALDNQGKVDEELSDPWGKKYHYPTFSPEVQTRLKEAVKALQIARIYAREVDYLFSGDNSEQSFLKDLKKELKKYEK